MAELYKPTTGKTQAHGRYELNGPCLAPKPHDIPPDHIGYNPSGIWTVNGIDIVYVRVEPDQSDPTSSHLGKTVVRPYVIDLTEPVPTLSPYDYAPTLSGEDPALTKIWRPLPGGGREKVWLLSCVNAKPLVDKPNEVATLHTEFWCGTDLEHLKHIADGPEWMKDIRIANIDGPLGTELAVYGRPQPQANSGNISFATIPSIECLLPEATADAQIIDHTLLPVGSGIWGGVNDIIRLDPVRNLLLAHRAWRSGPSGRHYEAVIFGHNIVTNRIIELGVLATAAMFPGSVTKADATVDLRDVVFTGGGYNGGLGLVTFGVGDGSIGIGKVGYSKDFLI